MAETDTPGAASQGAWVEQDTPKPASRASEGGFGCGSLVIGIICVVTAFTRGENFCTESVPNALHQAGVKAYSPLQLGDPHIFGHSRRLLGQQGPGDRVLRRLLADDIPQNGNISKSEVAASLGTGIHQLKQESNETLESSSLETPDTNTYVGPNGWVITWLKVEAILCFAPMAAAILEATSCFNVRPFTVAVVVLSGLLQSIWFIVGLVWTYGGYVPDACREAKMGDNTAFTVMWWICTAKLVLLALALPCCCLMFFCVFFSQKDSLLSFFEGSKRGEYTSVNEDQGDSPETHFV